MSEQFGSAEDALVKMCVSLQAELQEPDVNKILDMPASAFDMLMEEYANRYKKGKLKPSEVHSFG